MKAKTSLAMMTAAVALLHSTFAETPDAFVEYVDSNRSQYIDTGIIGRCGTSADMTVQWLDASVDSSFLSSRVDGNNTRFILCSNQGPNTHYYMAHRSYNNPRDISKSEYSKNAPDRIVSSITHDGAKVKYTMSVNGAEEINVESENKNSLTFTIQYYFSSNGLLKANYFIRGSAEYIITIFFPLFSSAKLPNVLKEYLLTSKKMNYFQRYNIFLILKSINKYYRINKEKVIFPEINYNNVQKYYEIIQNHLKENSIIQDEEIFTFFRKHFATHEEQEKIDETDTGDFSYTCDDKNYILEINKVLKLEETEIIFTKGKEIIKFKKLANQNISDIFQEMYSYYEFFLSQDFKVVNFDINKMNERIANLIFIFLKIKDEQNMVDLLIYLLHTMIDFKNKLAEYQNNQQ